MQSDYAIPAIIFGAIAVFAMVGERIAVRRRVPGRPGLVPWSLITILSLIVAGFMLAAWIREG